MGGRRGKSNQSFMTLIFPTQLPPMAVIYMSNRQHYVYKTILGKEDLNNFCQPSKGAGIGSDAGFLFPLLSSMCVLPRCLAMQQGLRKHAQTCGAHGWSFHGRGKYLSSGK